MIRRTATMPASWFGASNASWAVLHIITWGRPSSPRFQSTSHSQSWYRSSSWGDDFSASCNWKLRR